jgi:hypothetical protein
VNLKNKALRFAAAGALAFAAVGAVGASPASAQDVYALCNHGGHVGECTVMLGRETLWEANNTVNRTIAAFDQVEVQCWYTGGGPGTPKDGIWDHVVWTEHANGDNDPGPLVQGHIDDNLVDFEGRTPAQIGLPHC